MSNKFLGLRTVIYRVADLEKAKKWYTEILGFGPYFDQPFYVGFEVSGYELGLLPEEGKTEKAENVLVYWGVEDAKETYRKLLEQGATANEEPTDVGDGILVATVRDPWNNVFGIIYNPYFKPA
ncbi:MAG: VOC family protein [Bacteroidia bacterium]